MPVKIAERQVKLGKITAHYLTAGEGPPLVLLHGVGDSAATWARVMPALARSHRVYAPSFPGFGYSDKPKADYSPAFFTDFMLDFLDALAIERAALVGNSLGGLVVLRLALANPARFTALGLVDSSGLGREVSLALRLLTLPGYGNLAVAWNKTRVGAAQWALGMAALLFARPTRVPAEWLALEYRMARLPGFMEATRAALKSGLNMRGQRYREILLDELPRLPMPVLVVWGERDRVVPASHARSAVGRLARGQMAIVPDCGHLPQLEQADHFSAVLTRFLTEQRAQSA